MATQFPVSTGSIIEASDVNSSYYQGALAGTLNHASVNIGTTATQIVAANASRDTILIKNNGTDTMYLGLSGVTDSTGFELLIGESILLYNKEAIYAICSSGDSTDSRYLEAQ